MPNALITGSNRGLGLAWVRHLTSENWRVFASCRHPGDATELNAFAEHKDSISVHRCDVTVADDIRGLYWELEEQPIDLLITNAGVYLEKGATTLGSLRFDDWMRTLEVNVFGQVRIIEAFHDNLERARNPLVVPISSHMGSIADITVPGSYYYRSSKAALNAAMRGLAAELMEHGIGLMLLHPGGVMTRMGPAHGLSPEESVAGMYRLVEKFDHKMHGRFYRYDGSELPW
ncbi:SDR family oxidoreductase [Thiohalomonas denitrificans]|uniref:NAD(P)-dependent dehydrogenase, short-chain alcohol dehydrogenase family n=1 Tax=Thiohalomonas denitrificans TaxID=415747 RepID=A0A1G5QPB3_9GAMM|nr:SDR family oxidoreductase [Thiohalomonas denitrificans]SCZ63380.1 NAD(P)-dependent dehydrogenase, short-chain alcohol dehydrogenase family [Thiohalomonas denitrificans]